MKGSQAIKAANCRQNLTFKSDERQIGLGLLTIKEIQAYSLITAIRNVPV
jgi:hypothetical protein